jgi:hypothetical protein
VSPGRGRNAPGLYSVTPASTLPPARVFKTFLHARTITRCDGEQGIGQRPRGRLPAGERRTPARSPSLLNGGIGPAGGAHAGRRSPSRRPGHLSTRAAAEKILDANLVTPRGRLPSASGPRRTHHAGRGPLTRRPAVDRLIAQPAVDRRGLGPRPRATSSTRTRRAHAAGCRPGQSLDALTIPPGSGSFPRASPAASVHGPGRAHTLSLFVVRPGRRCGPSS